MESKIERYLIKRVKQRGGLCLKWVSPGTNGVPDRLIFIPKMFPLIVELKTVVGIQSKAQKYVKGMLEERGFPVYVLYGKEDVDKFVEMVDEVICKQDC